MIYKKVKNGLASIVILAIACVACNNQSSSDSTYDTTTVSADSTMSASSDTAQNLSNPDSSSSTSASQGTAAKRKWRASIQVTPVATNHKFTVDKSGIYDYAEVMPEFPGGQSALEDYINNNIQYPQSALDNNDEGRATVKFTVDENGKVSDAKSIGAKISSGLDAEAVRVVSSLPDWKPGTIKGKPVKVSLTLPVVFKAEQ